MKTAKNTGRPSVGFITVWNRKWWKIVTWFFWFIQVINAWWWMLSPGFAESANWSVPIILTRPGKWCLTHPGKKSGPTSYVYIIGEIWLSRYSAQTGNGTPIHILEIHFCKRVRGPIFNICRKHSFEILLKTQLQKREGLLLDQKSIHHQRSLNLRGNNSARKILFVDMWGIFSPIFRKAWLTH